jgi:hypothetical protein
MKQVRFEEIQWVRSAIPPDAIVIVIIEIGEETPHRPRV